jgi:hypothetical protein
MKKTDLLLFTAKPPCFHPASAEPKEQMPTSIFYYRAFWEKSQEICGKIGWIVSKKSGGGVHPPPGQYRAVFQRFL